MENENLGLFARLRRLFGSDPSMSDRHLLPALLFFFVLLVIDLYIQSSFPEAIAYRVFSKCVFMSSALWLAWINYVSGKLPNFLIWLANVLYGILVLVSIVFTAAFFDYLAIVVGLTIIVLMLGYLAWFTIRL